jgi:hypothetical protein
MVFGLGLLAVLAGLAFRSAGASDRPAKDERVFELRTYTTNPGKLEALHKRFRDHTNRIFKKHGIEIVGYWTPVEAPLSQDTLIYIAQGRRDCQGGQEHHDAGHGLFADPVSLRP